MAADADRYPSAEMARRGKIGAFVTHSMHDSTQLTANARSAFLARFEREVDPDLALAPEERQRRAEAARRAYFLRLSARSVVARRARAERKRREASSAGE